MFHSVELCLHYVLGTLSDYVFIKFHHVLCLITSLINYVFAQSNPGLSREVVNVRNPLVLIIDKQ